MKEAQNVASLVGDAADATLGVPFAIRSRGSDAAVVLGERDQRINVNVDGSSFEILAVNVQAETEEIVAFFVPELEGDARVIGMIAPNAAKKRPTFGDDLVNLTNVPRQNMGGFTLVTLIRLSRDK